MPKSHLFNDFFLQQNWHITSMFLTFDQKNQKNFAFLQLSNLQSFVFVSYVGSYCLKRSLVSSWYSSMRRNSVEGKLWLQRRQCVLEIMLDVFYCSGLIFYTLLHGYILFETNLCLRKVRVSTDNTFNFSRQGWEEIKRKMCFFT